MEGEARPWHWPEAPFFATAGLHGLQLCDAILVLASTSVHQRSNPKLLVPTFAGVGGCDHLPSLFEIGVLFACSRYLGFVAC